MADFKVALWTGIIARRGRMQMKDTKQLNLHLKVTLNGLHLVFRHVPLKSNELDTIFFNPFKKNKHIIQSDKCSRGNRPRNKARAYIFNTVPQATQGIPHTGKEERTDVNDLI